jgi:hypothetical protein
MISVHLLQAPKCREDYCVISLCNTQILQSLFISILSLLPRIYKEPYVLLFPSSPQTSHVQCHMPPMAVASHDHQG